ncbi:DUF2510 domain-containing protein [Cellulomonas sp. Leaf334]|uniref:DUF2510 domain-containing protein n=1 Tax=Cellulomonas sp. Leaf334 TaxID=1736339 RepID=UPI000B160539|nr:DUF2510 domain-containing protein [Cellulomonas sp. Leaf334]
MPRPPAGWYPSPNAVGTLRWWDGRVWTEHARPTVEDAPATPESWFPEPRASLEALPLLSGAPGTPTYGAEPWADLVPPDRRTRVRRRRDRARLRRAARTPPNGTVTAARAEEIRRAAHAYEELNGQRMQVNGGLAGAVAQLVIGLVLVVICVLGAPSFLSAFVGPGETSAHGIVVDLHLSTSTDGGRMCSAEAVFVVDGEIYPARSGSASSTCPPVGSSTAVIYTTASPGDGEARVPEPKSAVLPFLGMPMLGLAFAGTGVVALVMETRKLVSRRRKAHP